ncbi:cytochrome C oxidase subunit I [Leptospira interrogans serovar Hardjo-prajitno]|uniref:cytochrome c oxidase subunit I n=1 Tax=Leptospira interrogans TaxID=173 RepID=UPI000721E5CD|nr:cytochrome c oxidase subunit I [Leptospira interrogans]ALN98954.1 cytochrome C oxidase subunit I [Leptospira interrogans serovar Hardjo-prajitno]
MSTATASHTDNYLNHEKGIWSWLTTIDHKRIGIMYFFAIMSFFLLGGIFALLVRLELFTPGQTLGFVTPDIYNRMMTYHGAIMVFMMIVPGIPAIFGNFILPIQLGAKDVAFPRLNLASWYIFMTGAGIAAFSLFTQKVDTGWTFYTPYSISNSVSNGVIMLVMGAFVMGFSSILTGLNFIVTTHKLRAPGMTMNRIPLMVWALYATSIIQVLATPVLAITLLLLVAERTLGVGIFDPTLGGDPVLFQHFFWFYSHPAVYIMILPAMGVISELVATFSKKVIFGYTAIAYSSLAIAAVSFLVWGHHMFVSGQSEFAGVLFSFITMLVGVPTAIKLFNWISTMYKGSVRLDAPMLFAIGFMFLFTIGGLTGVFLASTGMDVHFHDTYFVVAHFHYVMVGGTLMAVMGALIYWFPKVTGKMTSDLLGRISWVFIFTGFNVTFFPQFILGSMGMPRRYYDYLPEFTGLNQISTIGSWLIGTGFLVGLIAVIHGLIAGKTAGDNPWGGKTLEWTIPSPPTHENFEKTPVITGGPYEYR